MAVGFGQHPPSMFAQKGNDMEPNIATIEYAIDYGMTVIWSENHLADSALRSARNLAENVASSTGREIVDIGHGFRVGAEVWTVKDAA